MQRKAGHFSFTYNKGHVRRALYFISGGGGWLKRDLSARRIIGFACNQAFVFFALFVNAANSDAFLLEGSVGGRFGLLCVLLFMVVGFALVRGIGPKRYARLFARPLLYLYAVLSGVGLLVPALLPDAGMPAALLQGALVGMTTSLLLTAWGRSFGNEPTETSVPEVFLGSLVGALVCLAFSLAPGSYAALAAVCLLPIAGVVNIEIGGDAAVSVSAASEHGAAQALSAKVIAGTALFGVAAGLVVWFPGNANGGLHEHYQVAIVLYGAFLIGGLSLLLSDGFGRGAALNKSYRLAVFVMMVGVVVAPWPMLAGSPLAGETVVFAGFLGLEAVLISLFLVLAEITSTDCGKSFSTGFLALFAGEFAGALLAAFLTASSYDAVLFDVPVMLAGIVILLSYVFLFTERDFDELSQLVKESDSLESAQEDIVSRYGLSNRESEILAYALRGRTSERIAQELVISKSTVDTHLRRIYAKCGVHSRQELLDLADRR